MNKKTLTTISVIMVAGLSLTACGNKTPKSLPASETKTLVEEVAPTATIGFDSPLDLGDGVSLTVATPVAFTPTIFASNYLKAKLLMCLA